jgi:hypothetical protein
LGWALLPRFCTAGQDGLANTGSLALTSIGLSIPCL